MIGLCFEAETTCSSCGKPLPINALVENIICTQCMHKNTFTVNEWKDLLESMFKEGPNYNENDGTPSTVMGARNYSIMYGRQNPKFLDTRKYIDAAEIIKYTTIGKIVNPETNMEHSIRPLPENFKEACPNVTHLLCEDFTQLPFYNGASQVLDQVPQGNIIPFKCPNCGGSMQIDGSERLLKCQFCSTESFIPDEVWQKLHPVKTKQRFYFWFDENKSTFDWDSDLWDMATDADGILYLSVEPIWGSNGDLCVVALKPDLTVKWKRDNLKFKTTTSGGEAKLGLTANGELMVWSGDRNTMLLLSTIDGLEIKRIGKKFEGTDKQENTLMDFAQCRYIAGDIDGNYFALINRERKDSDSDAYCEFMVIDKDAYLHKPWGLDETQSKGFFGSLKKAFSGMSEAPYFEKIKDKVYQCREYDVKISVGLDGSYYLLSYYHMAKYDRSGKQIYLKEATKGYIKHKLVGDKEGNAYYIFAPDGTDKSVLMKVSADGTNTSVLINSVLDGGALCKEDMVALSANGIIYCAGYGGRIRIFNMDGKLQYASPKSLEEEKEMIKKSEDMKD